MTHSKDLKKTQNCPCGTGKTYIDCCGIFITHQKTPPTPELLMRSRYTAYWQGNMEYIAQTMKAPASNNFDIDTAKKEAGKIHWIKLEVINATHDCMHGEVEFVAQYLMEDKKYALHEISQFNFVEEKWYYVDGTQPQEKPAAHPIKKIGRNEMCPCCSNKKYKKCCSTANKKQ